MLQIQVINVTLSIVTSALSLFLATYAWRQRSVPGATAFVGLVSAIAWVTWWYTFEAAVGTNLSAYISFSKLEYIGLSFIPLLWLGFALNFSGRERPISLMTRAILGIIPAVTILLAFTNEAHGLIWELPRFDTVSGTPVFAPTYGVWFWINVIYSYTIFLIGSIILVRYALNTWKLYRNQALLIFLGTALPWISNFLTIFHNWNPVPYFYLNAIFLGASVVSLALALFRLRLLDVAPLAYNTILNNVPDGIIVIDLKDRILAINTYIKPFLDFPNRDPIGLPLVEAFSRYAGYINSMPRNTDYKGEFEIDGTILEVRMSPAVNHQGNQRGHLIVLSDITVKAQAEKAQRAEQRFLEIMQKVGSILNSSLDTERVVSLILESLDQFVPHSCSNIMLVDEDGFTTRVAQQRGYSQAESAKLSNWVFDYRSFPLYTTVVETSMPFVIANTGKDSNWVMVAGFENVQSFASMPMLMDGKLVGFINIDSNQPEEMQPEMVNRLQIFGQQAALAIKNARLYEETFRQAAELKQRVNSLTITQQVYRDIGFSLDTHALLELVLDATLRISSADAGYVVLWRDDELKIATLYGNYELDKLGLLLKQRSGIIGATISERRLEIALPDSLSSALPGSQAQIAVPLIGRAEDGTENFYGIIVVETKNPKRFTEDRIQLLVLIADRVVAALHNVQLVNTVRDRAAELEVLYDKVKYLENFKSDMIRIAAHDLKNPLGVIRSYLTMLTAPSEFDVDLEKVYPAMLRSTDRMLQIVQTFLSLDRIEKAAEQETVEPFDLAETVARAAEEFTPRIEQKAQTLSVSIPETTCMVVGDSAQVYEAVTNFISNAVKYTPVGGEIAVRLVEDGENARLEVSDNGYGIPEDKQEKLFQPFYRAQTKEIAQIEGSGLGLHLTKNIVERQGGKIIFHSVYQQGSTFGFELPLLHPEVVHINL